MKSLFRMRPFPKRVIWAGERLSAILDAPGPENDRRLSIGETMEVGALPGMESVAVDVTGRAYALDYLWALAAPELSGGRHQPDDIFPILVKRLDAGQTLSLQVHPDDDSAHRLEGASNGKSEAWVVLEAAPGAGVWIGLAEGVTVQDFRAALDAGDPMEAVRFLPLAAGDAVPVPAGCVHAISGGLLIFEVQQPSDHTYRIHDFGRLDQDGRPRTLQVDKALRVIAPDLRPEIARPRRLEGPHAGRERLIELPTFVIERWTTAEASAVDVEGMLVVHVEHGTSRLRVGEDSFAAEKGSSFLVSAAAPELVVAPTSGAPVTLLVARPH